MRTFEAFLKVEGWASGYNNVQRLLDHLARKTKSESSRMHYLETLCFLCRRERKDPDQLVAVGKADAEGAVQSYLDWMKREMVTKFASCKKSSLESRSIQITFHYCAIP